MLLFFFLNYELNFLFNTQAAATDPVCHVIKKVCNNLTTLNSAYINTTYHARNRLASLQKSRLPQTEPWPLN